MFRFRNGLIAVSEPAGMEEHKLLERITMNPQIFGGKPIIRGRRLAVEHVLAMLAAGDSVDGILATPGWEEKISRRVSYTPAG
jgi:hypothetical protein